MIKCMKKMTRNEMKKPSELVKEEVREPISARVKESTMKTLEAEAKGLGVKTAALTAAVLDDYADWIRNKRN